MKKIESAEMAKRKRLLADSHLRNLEKEQEDALEKMTDIPGHKPANRGNTDTRISCYAYHVCGIEVSQ